MNPHTAAYRKETTLRFYCELCDASHINGDDNPIAHCWHCDCLLCPMYSYTCANCGRFFCDNSCQACQEDDCDIITCTACVDHHIATTHPPEIPSL